MVGDVVRNVAGEAAQVTVLLPAGADPHSYLPTPKDVAQLSGADVIFTNGLGLEEQFKPLLANAGPGTRLVAVSDGVPLLKGEPESEAEDTPASPSTVIDPHVWWDPTNVSIWVDNIEKTLVELDPANQETYHANAARYRQTLTELDGWVRTQVDQIPQANRKLVTDHKEFSYLANRYGFEQVGAVLPGFSTLSEPSAQELAALEDAIRKLGVKAVFVGNTVNPTLARQVTVDTQTQLVLLYTDSLTPPGGPADTYEKYIRYNIAAITQALK
jgi:ABC-type Zn uptake system ZnuABC Zn-binding protein ZnuA